jgi:putative tryptophan/tyrosine transport system substrate-binding protein
VRRREFILLGGAAAFAAVSSPWPLRAEQPTIGFLRGSTAGGSASVVGAFHRGLREAGFVEGQNVTLDYRWSDNKADRLPGLAADLVRRQVAVILASGSAATLAAKAATSTIPIVFVTPLDPVAYGLVATLNRPGGNATGVSYLTSVLGGKRLEFLRQLVPAVASVAVLVNPGTPLTETFLKDVQAGAGALGLQIHVAAVTSESDLDDVFATLARQRPGALIVGSDPLFTARSVQIAALAARHALPAIYPTREFAESGGLMAWGTSLAEQYRVAGNYTGKILKGAKPAEMPVQQPSKYELVLNLKTAKALSLDVPATLLALADEVIE